MSVLAKAVVGVKRLLPIAAALALAGCNGGTVDRHALKNDASTLDSIACDTKCSRWASDRRADRSVRCKKIGISMPVRIETRGPGSGRGRNGPGDSTLRRYHLKGFPPSLHA